VVGAVTEPTGVGTNDPVGAVLRDPGWDHGQADRDPRRGTGGTLSANRLRRLCPGNDVEIVVVDQNDDHVYQPGLLFVPFGLTHGTEIVRSRRHQLHKGIEFRLVPVERVDIQSDIVHLGDGTELSYDALVVASGSVLVEEETEGLTGPGWMEKVFTFYDVGGAAALHDALEGFDGGRLVVNVVDMPIKCPVAPWNSVFWPTGSFQRVGIRDRVELTYVTRSTAPSPSRWRRKLWPGCLRRRALPW